MLARRQIYLEDSQVEKLKIEASRQKNLDVSKIIRIAIDNYLNRKKSKVDWDNDPMVKMIGSCKSDVQDASINHDHYLYGKPKCK